jgi:hypothetical protein
VEKLTLEPASVTTADADAVRAEGVSDTAISDAIHVCYLFSTIDRLADAFGFALPSKESHDRAALVLLKRGYTLPAPLAL